MRSAPWKVIIALLCLLAACVPQPRTEPAPAASLSAPLLAVTPSIPPTVPAPTNAPTPSELAVKPTEVQATPTPLPPAPLPRYTINLDFSYDNHSGHVDEWIEYPNPSAQPLTDLRLMVPLYQYRDALRISALSWSGGALDGQGVENALVENIQIVIPLPTALLPGETVGLHVTYDFTLPSQAEVSGERPLPIGYTSRQRNLVDWFLFVPPFRDGMGWLAHPLSYYGENLVYDLADFEVNLRLVDGRKDLVIAASSAGKEDGEWVRFTRPGSRTFALSIGHEYVVETAQAGSTTVSSYYFPLNALAGKRALQTTVEAVELYTKLFGAYPHDTLAVVEADFLDGMEYDGLYFLSRAFYNVHKGDPGDYLVAIAAHETAHQWWYGLVGNDQANEPWLDEALCTYSERLYYEHYYPQVLDWWWQYRINYYNPRGWVNTSVYNPQGALQTYQDYRNAVYLNGAHFLEDLRSLVGDEAFFAFLADYSAQYAGKIAFQGDFFQVLKQHTQADLTPLLQQYFYGQ